MNIHKAWAPHTWKLLHCMASHIHTDYFLQEKNNIISIFKSICENLPCPQCRNHARKFILRISFNVINTKDLLIRLFFDFHNHVNIITNSPIFNINSLDSYYKHDLKQTLSQWNTYFKLFHSNPYTAQEESRRIISRKHISLYFIKNYHKFIL
jgi:hypothetical protein